MCVSDDMSSRDFVASNIDSVIYFMSSMVIVHSGCLGQYLNANTFH